MIGILGEYEATLDLKNRFLLPVGFKKQLPEEDTLRFIMNRGMDGCLTLFTLKAWEPFYAKMNALDEMDEDERPVRRFFLGGPTPVEPDTAGRILIPAHLKAYAGLQKDLVLHWAGNNLEIWDSNKYKEFFDSITPKTLSGMVHKVFGKKGGGNG